MKNDMAHLRSLSRFVIDVVESKKYALPFKNEKERVG